MKYVWELATYRKDPNKCPGHFFGPQSVKGEGQLFMCWVGICRGGQQTEWITRGSTHIMSFFTAHKNPSPLTTLQDNKHDLSVSVWLFLSIHLSVCPSIHLSACLSVCLSLVLKATGIHYPAVDVTVGSEETQVHLRFVRFVKTEHCLRHPISPWPSL